MTSTESNTTVADASSSKHPLAALGEEEIEKVATLIRKLWAHDTALQFKVLTLQEPPKDEVLIYLDAEHGGRALPHLDRKAYVSYYIRNTVSH